MPTTFTGSEAYTFSERLRGRRNDRDEGSERKDSVYLATSQERTREAVAGLLSAPKDAMTRQQKKTLDKLAQHYGATKVREQRLQNHRSKRPQSDKNAPRNPWGRFLILKSLYIPPVSHHHVQEHGADPGLFFTDNGSLRRTITDFGDESDAVGDAFVSRYKYTIELADRRTTDNWRWCFVMLTYYGLIKLIKPDGSGRVGRLMYKEIMDFLDPLLGMRSIKPNVAFRQLREWSLEGFDYQSISTGEYYDGPIAHLNQLRLAQKAAQSGANELEHGIRQLTQSAIQKRTGAER
ncbi:MAG: hypothetical protein ASARMPREDX12_009434 [Alectoria sarmentosa]|nr:MAG: hypothetical protein ASARMPREDX12_009434 [Alectoria sarmentosa]